MFTEHIDNPEHNILMGREEKRSGQSENCHSEGSRTYSAPSQSDLRHKEAVTGSKA